MSNASKDLPSEVPPTTIRGFFVIFLVSFLVFLVVAMTAQLAGLHWRQWFPGAESERSLLLGVKSAVYSFMSYLT